MTGELTNPLAPVLVSIEILRRAKGLEESDLYSSQRCSDGRATSPDLSDRIDHALEVLQRQVGQMVRLVDDLLDAGRISRGRSTFAESASSCHPSFTMWWTPLAQSLSDAPVRFAPQVVISVRDTGIGIAADQLEHVFEMFTQGDTSLERSVTGLGIGLTLVKTLTEMHGSTVEVYSAAGQGSEFVVRLPLAVETDTPSSRPAPTPSVPITPLQILIADDNHDSADMLATLLQFAGHETFTAHDGLTAVEDAARLDPDVILLDIGLPVLNGYEAAHRIRQQQGQKRRLLLVALTGWGQEDDRLRSEAAGFDAHLIKPVDDAFLASS